MCRGNKNKQKTQGRVSFILLIINHGYIFVYETQY